MDKVIFCAENNIPLINFPAPQACGSALATFAGATDSKFCDAQAGAEVAFQCLTSAAVGSGLVHDCSSWMDHGSLVSPEFMVLVHDIVDSVHHFMNGIPVTQETLAVDVIDKVGPGGHYLTEKHTMDHFRQIKYSELFDRTIYDKWEKASDQRLNPSLCPEFFKKGLDIGNEPDTGDDQQIRFQIVF